MNDSNVFSTLSLIDSMQRQFTKTDWKIVNYIKTNPLDFVASSAATIAEEIGVSDASVIRFAQKTGFKGLYEMRTQLERELELQDTTKRLSSNQTQFEHDFNLYIQRFFSLVSPSAIEKLVKSIRTADEIYICSFKRHSIFSEHLSRRLFEFGKFSYPVTSLSAFQNIPNNKKNNSVCVVVDFDLDLDELALLMRKIEKFENTKVLYISSNYIKHNFVDGCNVIMPPVVDLKMAEVLDKDLFLSIFTSYFLSQLL